MTTEIKKESKWKTLGEVARTIISVMGVFTLIGAPLWTWVLRPALVTSVSTAMAQTIDDKIDATVIKRVAPMNSGMKAIIQGTIIRLQERIDRLQYKREFQAAQYTDQDRDELFKLQQDLSIQQQALNDILSSERD